MSRNLWRGRFLLLIVGDGIQEGIRSMTEFLQQHAAMHFTLGVVELAIFTLPDGSGHVVQPRILTRTTMIQRGVVELADDRMQPSIVGPARSAVATETRPLAKTVSEEMFLEELEAWMPGSSSRVKSLLTKLMNCGVSAEMLPASLKLSARIDDIAWPVGTISAREKAVWFDSVLSKAKSAGRPEVAMEYYRRVVGLIDDPHIRAAKLHPMTKSGIASLPLVVLLDHVDGWVDCIVDYLKVTNQAEAS